MQMSFTDGLIAPEISPGVTPSIERVVAPIFLRSDLVELVDGDKVRVWHEPTDIGFSRYYECSVYPTGTADSEATTTESTSNTTDGSNNQTDDSSNQTDGSNGTTQNGVNNQPEASDTSGNSGGGSIDTWVLFLFFSVSGANIWSSRKTTKAENSSCAYLR